MAYAMIFSVIACVVGLYYFFFESLNLFRKHNIPHLRPLPLLGNRGRMPLLDSLPDFVKRMYNVHPEAKYVGMYDFTTPLIILRDPELIKSVAVKHFDHFPDHRTFVRDNQDPLFSKILLSLRGDQWRNVRNVQSPAFTSSKMKSMFKLMSDYATDFANSLAQLPSDQKVLNTKDIFTRYTHDIIAICIFGISVDSMRNPQNPFYANVKTATNVNSVAVLKFIIFRNLPWLARVLDLRFIPEKFAKFFRDFVKTIIKTRDENDIVRPDMLQLMMESRNRNDGRNELTVDIITSQVFSFYFGGFDTASALICFAAHEIAVNEDVQKRLQSEIDQVLEDTNGQSPYDVVNNMEYLDAVVNEALRMYPSIAVSDRVCVKDFELPPTLPDAKPYLIRKGQALWIPIYALHRDPKYFEEPDKFNPDRFLGEQKKHTINTGAFLPFGLGPRICVAKRFALMGTKVLLFYLLARCDLLPCEKTSIPPKLSKGSLIINAEGGFWLKAVPRKNHICIY